MRVHQETVSLRGRPRALLDLTEELSAVVQRSLVTTGVCSLFLRHTSAGLLIQENADPAVLRDLARWIEGLAPESDDYEHAQEGPDDMPGHLRAVLTRQSESIPVTDGRLALGTWQGVYLYEHRAHAGARQVVITVIGA
jgi:secondary thiamine-phosphate synthase enzyme